CPVPDSNVEIQTFFLCDRALFALRRRSAACRISGRVPARESRNRSWKFDSLFPEQSQSRKPLRNANSIVCPMLRCHRLAHVHRILPPTVRSLRCNFRTPLTITNQDSVREMRLQAKPLAYVPWQRAQTSTRLPSLQFLNCRRTQRSDATEFVSSTPRQVTHSRASNPSAPCLADRDREHRESLVSLLDDSARYCRRCSRLKNPGTADYPCRTGRRLLLAHRPCRTQSLAAPAPVSSLGVARGVGNFHPAALR